MSTLDLNIDSNELRVAAKKAYYRQNLTEFFKRELKISTKAMGGAQPFIPNSVQVPIIQGMEKQKKEIGKIRAIIFKCRQPGISTLSSGVIWNGVALHSGVYAFITAQDKSTVENIFQMHDVFYRRMDPDLRRPLKYYNKGSELILGDQSNQDEDLDSRLYVGESKNINLGVGRTVHLLHMSEICRYPSYDSIVESLIPACSDFPGTIQIFESTAHFGGGAAYFKEICEQAQAGYGQFKYYFVEWWKLPEYSIPLDKGEKLKLDIEERHLVKKTGLSLENIKWRRNKIHELKGNLDLFQLSYPLTYSEAWITKERSTFPRERLREMLDTIRDPIRRFSITDGRMFENTDNGEFWIWDMPEKDKLYDVGADVAEGFEDGDWSVAEVIERGTNKQVAEYRAHILPRAFGDSLACIGRFYNNAQIACEINNSGGSANGRLNEIYQNCYQWRKRDTLAVRFTGKIGWQTSYESKQYLVDFAREKIYYRQVLVRSRTLYQELGNFVLDFTPTGMVTYRASSGYDDCCMSWMIALLASDDECFEKSTISVKDVKFLKPQQDYIDYSVFRDNDGLFGPKNDGPRVDTRPWR